MDIKRTNINLVDKASKGSVQTIGDFNSKIVDEIDAAIYIADIKNYNILFANKRMSNIFGDVIGKTCYEVFQKRDYPCDFCTNGELLDKEGKPTKPLIWEKFNEIAGRWYELRDQVIEINGQYARFEMATDITERRGIRQLGRVDALKKACKGVSHIVKNKSFIISGWAEMLESMLETEEQKECLNEIKEGLNGLLDPIEVLHEYSSVGVSAKEPFSIDELLDDIVLSLVKDKSMDIDIKKKYSAVNNNAYANSDEIKNAIINICDNGIQVMNGNGTLVINVEDYKVEEPTKGVNLEVGEYVKISIKDNGPGISIEHIDNIFEPFFTTRTDSKSLGLNLSVTESYIKKNNGAVKVYSKPNEGARFDVYIPISKENVVVTKEQTINHIKGKETIMCVDDEESILGIFEAVLSGAGYNVLTFKDGIYALEYLEHNPDSIDLLLTDIRMPIMNGPELAKKALELRNDLPVVICTGGADYSREDALRDGILDYIKKPISPIASVCEIVRKNLDYYKK